MSERLGPMASGAEREQVFLGREIAQRREYSEATAREVDDEVKSIVDETFERALATLREHREALDLVAELLLEREELSGEEVVRLIER